jgi:hypothetical protein
MTTAPETGRVDRGRGHTYLLDGRKVPGVTTIIGNGLPKPALINWAGNVTAEYAVDHWDELTQQAISDRLNVLKKCRYAERDAAANRGTQVHNLAEQLVHGTEVDVPDELAGHVESCVKFLDDWKVTPVVVERPVFNRTQRYAGTLDIVADLSDGRRLLIDYKTNKSGPFGEVALQLAAYRYAEFYLDEASAEIPMPEVEGCAVAWIRADGYELVPITAGPEQLRAFLYVAQVAQFADIARDLIGEALTPPRLQESA